MSGTFEQLIVLSAASDLVFALAIAFAAFWFDRRLQERRARDETLRELATSRAAAFASLWQLTQSATSGITRDGRTKLDQELNDWYYEKAGALYLSWGSADCFLRALSEARDESTSGKQLAAVFSALRTELKIDAGIYRPSERKKQLFRPASSPSINADDGTRSGT